MQVQKLNYRCHKNDIQVKKKPSVLPTFNLPTTIDTAKYFPLKVSFVFVYYLFLIV